jgi:tRNA pseudouridine55 synthase
VAATSDVRPLLAQVEAALECFTGEIEQVPPAYSAIKVDGKRAYDLARAGEDVEMKSRRVTVYEISPVLAAEGEREGLSQITLLADVSKGTYIRSLARDIARAAGTVGHVAMLRRTRAGPFALDRAISLDKLNAIGKGAPLELILLPLEAGLDDILALDLDPEQAGAVRQGRVLTGVPLKDGLYWARAGLTPIALMELVSGNARVLRGFNLQDVAE